MEIIVSHIFFLPKIIVSIIVSLIVIGFTLLFFIIPISEVYPKIKIWISSCFYQSENIAPLLYACELMNLIGEGAYRWLEELSVVKKIISSKIIYAFRTVRILVLFVPYSVFMIFLLLSIIYYIVLGDMKITSILGRFIFVFILFYFHSLLIRNLWNDRWNDG